MRSVLAALALLAASPAQAADPAPPLWQGVWHGTIGTLPVRACFSWSDGGYQRGSYYYLSSKTPISLSFEKDGSWSEHAGEAAAESGRWKVVVSADGTLRGEWKGGGKALPVRLRAIGGQAEHDEGCYSRTYLVPRLQPVKVSAKPARVPGLAFSQLTYTVSPSFTDVDLRGFTFAPIQPGDKAILAGVRVDADKSVGLADYAACMAGSIGLSGSDGEFGLQIDPEWASPAFLSVMQSSSGFCGGAHPYYGYQRELWDRQSGRKIDLVGWFAGKVVGSVSSGAVSADLRAVVVRHFKSSEAECSGAANDQEWWGIGLTRTGFVFTPSFPHVIAACTDDAHVPFAEVARFLAPAGKAGVARVKAGGK